MYECNMNSSFFSEIDVLCLHFSGTVILFILGIIFPGKSLPCHLITKEIHEQVLTLMMEICLLSFSIFFHPIETRHYQQAGVYHFKMHFLLNPHHNDLTCLTVSDFDVVLRLFVNIPLPHFSLSKKLIGGPEINVCMYDRNRSNQVYLPK